MTAISFTGQNTTRLFDEPSGDYTTSNQMFKFSNGLNLFLVTGYATEHRHKKYLGNIFPDVTAKAIKGGDSVILVANSWIVAAKIKQ